MKRLLMPLSLAALFACEKPPEPDAKPIADAAAEEAKQAAAPASGTAQPNELLMTGTITAGEGMTVPENATLFVMGRTKVDSGKGSLVLVKRFHPVTLPLEFSLTGSDVMMQGSPIPNEFAVTARLDQDGDAISKTPGDLTGDAGAVSRGAKDVALVLDASVSEAKPSAPVQ